MEFKLVNQLVLLEFLTGIWVRGYLQKHKPKLTHTDNSSLYL